MIRLLLILSFIPTVVWSAPVILYTDITSGPNVGGENNKGVYLSIFGTGLGTPSNDLPPATTKVYINNVEVGAYHYLGPSKGRPEIQQLSVQVGTGTTPNTATGARKVEESGTASNTGFTFTVRPGDIYWISPDGDDGTGTVNDITKPYQDPEAVDSIGAFGADDFMILRGGTFDIDDGNYSTPNGSWIRYPEGDTDPTAGHEMVIYGHPGEDVIVQVDGDYEVVFANSDYITVANIYADIKTCDNTSVVQMGLPASSTYCTNDPDTEDAPDTMRMVNIEVDGNDSGLMCAGTSGNNVLILGYSQNSAILGCSIHNGGDTDTSASHPIYLSSSQHGTDVGWNTIYQMPEGRGMIQAHQDNLSTCDDYPFINDIDIHDNVLHDFYGQAVVIDNGVGDLTLRNNLIYNPMIDGQSASYEVFALRGNDHQQLKIYNNVIYGDIENNGTEDGIFIRFGFNNGDPLYVELYNNIIVTTDPNDVLVDRYDSGFDYDTQLESGNNIWYGSSAGLPVFAGTGDVVIDPKFVNPTTDFSVQSNSPAINNGVQVNAMFTQDIIGATRGTTWDIGAYEYETQIINAGQVWAGSFK